ncbi:MAG: hypothetical protein R2754_11425 [Microthrixaceae bacterium]
MAIKVIQWATGTVGEHAVRGIVDHPRLELAGLWVHSERKEGVDAGELVGIAPTGVIATRDAGELLASDAEVICYTANSDLRPDGVVDDLERMLRLGKNVVNTSFVPLLYPPSAGPGVAERLQAAAIEGGATLYTSGIDPGYGNVGVAVGAAALCKNIDQIRMAEIVNYATWDNPFTMFEIMGFGKADEAESLLLAPGTTTLAWGPVIELVASAVGLGLDEIVERHEVIYAKSEFDIASGTIPAGGLSGMRFEVVGMIGGAERVVLEHVTRLRDEDRPDWRQGSGYHIDITGDPSVHVEVGLSSPNGDHNHAGCLATAMHVLNAVPAVVAAEPGVVTMLDLPVYSGDATGGPS